MNRSKPSSIPGREVIARELARRANRRVAESLEELADPDWPAWPPEADDNPEAWMEEHWSQAALDDYEISKRELYFETMDTVMGAITLAVWELRTDHAEVARLLGSVGLTIWSAGASTEQADEFRRRKWGAWEWIYFEDWHKWAPLEPRERQAAHAKSWREHLAGEVLQERSFGRCWWRTCCDPNPNAVVAHVDIAAGLRLASECGHDESYPRPDEEGVEEE